LLPLGANRDRMRRSKIGLQSYFEVIAGSGAGSGVSGTGRTLGARLIAIRVERDRRCQEKARAAG
jgi:hypothetical protein